jgi:hypothetical protein
MAERLRVALPRLFEPVDPPDLICPEGCGQAGMKTMPQLIWHVQSRCNGLPDQDNAWMHCAPLAFMVTDHCVECLERTNFLSGPQDLLQPSAIPYPCGNNTKHRSDHAAKEYKAESAYLGKKPKKQILLPTFQSFINHKLTGKDYLERPESHKYLPNFMSLSFIKPAAEWTVAFRAECDL